MKRWTVVLATAGLMLGLAGWAGAAGEPGETRGTVVGAQTVKMEGVEVISISILTNSGSKQTLLVSAKNAGVYETAKGLKTNDKVHAWWESGKAGKKWVTRLEVGAGR